MFHPLLHNKFLRLTLVLALLIGTFDARPVRAAPPTIIIDSNGQTTIQVFGSTTSLSLADIANGLGTNNLNYLVNLGSGVWRLNANLLLDGGATLDLSPATGVKELQLRSTNTSPVGRRAAIAPQIFPGDEMDAVEAVAAIDYASFVYVRVYDSTLNIDGVKIYSWDEATGGFDLTYDNGRAYLLAKFAATMNVSNAEISFLGSGDGESYGLAWRDNNGSTTPDVLRTRVTGKILNSKIHHLYYGVYTYQAQNMTVRNNEFYQNVRYGFDPHDYSHDFIVEDNIAYENGAHGFIISRGCYNFTFRRNKSYNNFDDTTNRAHGFMLDPGGLTLGVPRAPSHHNLLEDNVAYGNEGYGIRVLMAEDNIIQNNNFHHNLIGVSLELTSTRNTFSGNQLTNGLNPNPTTPQNVYGVYVRDGAINNTFRNNLIAENAGSGFYFETGAQQNVLTNNFIHNNTGYGISASGATTIRNRWTQNTIYGNVVGGIRLTGGANQAIAAPVLINAGSDGVTGQATAGATVEVFSDSGVQGQFYEGQATVDGNGNFTFNLAGAWQATKVTAIAIDSAGNASPFSNALTAGTAPLPTATPTHTPTHTPTGPTATATPTHTANPPNATTTPTVTGFVTPTPTHTTVSFPAASATATFIATIIATAPTAPGTVTHTPTATPAIKPTNTTTATPVGRILSEQIFLPLVRK